MNEELKLSMKASGIALAVTQAFSPGAMAQAAIPPAAAGQPASLAECEQAEVAAVNREPMKATFFNFESRDLAIAGDMAASRSYHSLDGTWSFAYSPNPGSRPKISISAAMT